MKICKEEECYYCVNIQRGSICSKCMKKPAEYHCDTQDMHPYFCSEKCFENYHTAIPRKCSILYATKKVDMLHVGENHIVYYPKHKATIISNKHNIYGVVIANSDLKDMISTLIDIKYQNEITESVSDA